MHFATPIHPNQRASDDEHQPFELSQYTPMGVQHFSAQYKHDPKTLEKLSKRICARVEQDSSDLITFCDKRIRKRRKKKRFEDEQRIQQNLEVHADEDTPAAPQIVAASDLLLGNCLGQGSFSSVFVLEKHLYARKEPTEKPRRGRRSNHSRHNRSMSNHSSITNDNSTSNRASTRTGRSQTPSLRRRLKKRISGNSNDDSIRSDCSQRSRSLSLPRSKNEKAPVTYQDDSNISSPIKVLRSPQRVSSSERTRSRSLSASIQNGIRNVVRRISISNRPDTEEDCEVPLSSPSKSSFMRKSKSHHVRPQHKEDNNSRSGRSRSIFRGGSRSLSCHQRRKSRRSRSRGDHENEEADDIEDSTPQNKGVVFASSGQTDLVVKILQPKLMNQPKLFANCAAGLIREGLFLASIDHPHVLKVHAWTSPNGWMDFASLAQKEGDLYDGYLLVLERLMGGSLKGWMRKWQIEHAEEQKAISAVAAMEERKHEKSQRKRLGLPRSLSFTGSSMESNSLSGSSQHLRHTVLRRKEKECSSPQSTATDSTYSQFSSSDRSLPYDCKWPTTHLSDRMSLLMQLSDTVKYLHKHRILHRDLKPDNLGVTFVDPNTKQKKEYPSNLSLKVFDFDIARLVPEDPTEHEQKSLRKSKHKRRGQSVDRSVKSLDADMFVSSKRGGRSVGGRSVSPLRSSNSLGGGDPSQRSRRKKYRGQRPTGRPNNTTDQPTSPIPTVISAVALEEPETLPVDALFEMTAKMGSPRYMAPEIARGEAYNLKSEVYTVCLLVHEVLTLQKPYDELAPEDHSKLVHFDLPGYRPPIYSEWEWPAELEEVLHLGWGDISQRPSMKDVHSVLKKALPRICPDLLMRKSSLAEDVDATITVSNSSRRTRSIVTTPPAAPSLITRSHSEAEKDHSKKMGGRSLFRHRSHHSRHSTRSGHKHRSSSLTPTASNSDFSLSNDEPLAAASVAQ